MNKRDSYLLLPLFTLLVSILLLCLPLTKGANAAPRGLPALQDNSQQPLLDNSLVATPSVATPTPTPTCSPPSPTPPVTGALLEITSGSNVGAPGSFFNVIGRRFPANIELTLYINDRVIGSKRTNSNGIFEVTLLTLPTTRPGSYRFSVGKEYNTSLTIVISPQATVSQPDVSQQALTVTEELAPESHVYLPFIQAEQNNNGQLDSTVVDPCNGSPTVTPIPSATGTAVPSPTATATQRPITLSIIAPAQGALVLPSFSLQFATNWPVQPGGKHIHWLLDGLDKGAIFSISAIPVNNLSPGSHTIRLQLAEADHRLIGVEATVTFSVQQNAPTVTPTSPPPTGDQLSDLTINGLVTFMQQKQIGDMKTLLSAMPRSLRRNYTFVEQTRSANLASLEQPRVIVFGSDARFMFSFGTNPSDPNYNKLDLAELDPVSGKWLFRELDMGTTPPTLSSDDAKCQECHGSPTRPIWNAYPKWPGIFGGQDDVLTAAHADRINRMISEQGTSERLHFLEIVPQRSGTFFSLPGRDYPLANTDFTTELGPAVGFGIFKRMQSSPRYQDLRNGFMLLKCDSSIQSSPTWQRFATAMQNAGATPINLYNLVKALGISPEHDFQINALPAELKPGDSGFFWNQTDDHLYNSVVFLVWDDIIRANPQIAQFLATLPEDETFGDGKLNLEASRQYKLYAAFEVVREARQDLRQAPKLPGQRFWDNIFRFSQGVMTPAQSTVCNYLRSQP